MDFLIETDAAGNLLAAHGNVLEQDGHLYGLSGIGASGIEGLIGAYHRGGAAFSASWIGQYSAAIVTDNTLVLAQSSLGLGRAYYAQDDDKLVVGSDLSAVSRAVECTEPDPIFFSRFLSMHPALDRTPYSAVRQLFGGETLIFRNWSKCRLRPWQPTQQTPIGDPLDRLRALLEEAIDTYASYDRSTIIDISGGTDSSLVAAVAVDKGRELHAISHIPARGARGDDCYYARQVASQLSVPLTEIDGDLDGMTTALSDLPDQPGNCSYRDTTRRISGQFRSLTATRHLTGVGGDVIFDFRGLAPAFLADPLVAGRPLKTWRMASAYARERGGHRSAAHFLRYVALPVAVSHLRGKNTGAPPQIAPPDWLDAATAKRAGAWRAPLARAVARPSARFLWELVFDMTAAENRASLFAPVTETFHPLLHRPLVEHCLSLEPQVRRGLSGDRALQRKLLRQLGLEEVANRSDKGSAQPLREMHLSEEDDFLDSLKWGEIASRGWIEPMSWHRAIDQIKVGASPNSVRFAAAVECELWLRRAVMDGHIAPLPATCERETGKAFG